VPYSAFAFTYKYAVITRSRAAAMAASAASGSAAAAAPPDAAVAGSPPAADTLNGPTVLDARLAGLSLAGTTANGPLLTSSIVSGGPPVEYTAVASLPAAVPAAALDTSTSAAAAAAAAAIAGQPSYVAAFPPQPPGQVTAGTGAGISAIFRNATSTLLEVGEPRVCRWDRIQDPAVVKCLASAAHKCCPAACTCAWADNMLSCC
jgi:hypothetical protein